MVGFLESFNLKMMLVVAIAGVAQFIGGLHVGLNFIEITLVQELRGAEALTLLKAWNTGHPGGLTTIHAAGPESALIRLETLIQEGNVPPQPRLICETVDLVVSIAQTPSGRRLTGIAAVDSHDPKSGFRLRRVQDGD
jgi:Flp pilus assembly CpaF family ATPase